MAENADDSTHMPNVNYGRVIDNVWDNADDVAVDADCSPTKVCRNAREFTFEGIAEGDDDLNTSWRRLLASEGKLASADSAPSIRDLVLGADASSESRD